jgi:hypothetical protein
MDYSPDQAQPELHEQTELFIIGATSPQVKRYFHWRKQNDLSLVIMDIPGKDEIRCVLISVVGLLTHAILPQVFQLSCQ